MSSSSESVDSDSSSSSISIPNISKLQPYDLEPTIPSSEVSSNSNSDEGTSDSEQEKERIGNTDWCVCGGKYRPMESSILVMLSRMGVSINRGSDSIEK